MRMKKHVLLALSCALASTSAGDVMVKTMTFNIRTSYTSEDRGYRCGNWDGERRGNVVAQFTAVDADFVGTQETSDKQKGYLDDVLKDRYLSIGKSSGSLNNAASEVNALYYKTQNWKLLADGMFWLGPNPDVPSADWGMKYYRTCAWGRFQHIQSGKTVCVLNTHFETPGNDLAQTKGAEIILKRINSVCQPSDSLTVILGDFNAKKSYPAMQKFFTEQWLDPSDDGTFCGNMLAPVGACVEKFDFVLYQDRTGMCRLKSEVVRQSFAGCYPSDHAAFVSSFCLDGTCCEDPLTKAQNTTNSAIPSFDFGSKNTENNASAADEAVVLPGYVVPAGEDRNTQDRPNGTAPTDGVQHVSTKTEDTSTTAGTIVAVFGVMGVAGVVCALVLKKKHALEAEFANKSGLAPVSVSFFSRADAEALSPRASSHCITMSRKTSSPVPTLEMNEEDRQRSWSTSSSITCSRTSPAPLSECLSSVVMLDANSVNSDDSRMYLSETNDIYHLE